MIGLLLIIALVAVVVALFAWAVAKFQNASKPRRVVGNAARSFHRRHIVERRKLQRYRKLLPVERFALWLERMFAPPGAIGLANELGTMNEHGIENLALDPASVNAPVASRYLLYKRGATGKQYCDLAGAGDYPLGPSSDSPYATGDIVNIRRLGAKPGLEIGIGVANKACTIDNLVVGVAGGKIQDLTTVTTNAAFWVVGRAAQTIAATNSTMEIGYVPCTPYQITVSNGGGTYARSGEGT